LTTAYFRQLCAKSSKCCYVWEVIQKTMSKFLIKLFIKFGKSTSVRSGLILMLKSAAEKTDNEIDDAIVKMIEEKLFPVK